MPKGSDGVRKRVRGGSEVTIAVLSGFAHVPVRPRKLRVEYPGAIDQVMNRGDRRESVFLSDSDRLLFLETLAQTCEKNMRIVDFPTLHTYGQAVKTQSKKTNSKPKLATPQDVVRLARRTKWQDVKLPKGEIVGSATIRQMFAHAERSLRRRKTHPRAHAAAA